MKRAVRDIYMLILMIFFISGFSTALRIIFQVKMGIEQAYLIGVFVIILGLAFIMDRTISILVSGFSVIIYATWIYYLVYTNKLGSDELIGYYQWFINLPLAAIIGSTIKSKLDFIEKSIAQKEKVLELYSVRDGVTLLKNKREFLFYLSLFIRILKNKNIKSSALIIEITDFSLLRSSLNSKELEELYRYMSISLKKVVVDDVERFFLGKGKFAVLLWNVDSDKLIEMTKEIKNKLKEEIKYPDAKTGVKYIPFKIASITVSEKDEDEIQMYKRLEKGLEYDV